MSASSSAQPLSSTVDPTINANIQRKLKRMRESVEDLQKQGADILAEIDKADAHHKAKLQEQYNELQQHRKQVESEQHAWEETAAKIRKVSADAPRRVTLNIGGQRFEVSIDTLIAEKDTFFAGLFSANFASPVDKNGEVFIDRDGTHFRLILNHMRGIDVMPFVEKLSSEEKKLLEQDVDYYQIESLEQLLGMRKSPVVGRGWDLDETKKHASITLQRNEDGSTSATGSAAMYCPILGESGFASGIHEWQVRVDKCGSSDVVVIGVCRFEDMKRSIDGSAQKGHNYIWGKDNRAITYAMNRFIMQEREWSTGDVIKVMLDCDQGKLQVDDVTLDVPAKGELYPAFLLFAKTSSTSFTLLP